MMTGAKSGDNHTDVTRPFEPVNTMNATTTFPQTKPERINYKEMIDL